MVKAKTKTLLSFALPPPKNELLETEAYRCPECGYLELYAL